MKRMGRVIFFKCGIITSLCFLLFARLVSCDDIVRDCAGSAGILLPRECCKLVNSPTVVCNDDSCPQGYYNRLSLCPGPFILGPAELPHFQNITAVTFCCPCYNNFPSSASTGRCREPVLKPTTVSDPSNDKNDSLLPFTGYLVAAGLFAVVLLTNVTIFIVVIVKRRRNFKSRTSSERPSPEADSTIGSTKHLTPISDGISYSTSQSAAGTRYKKQDTRPLYYVKKKKLIRAPQRTNLSQHAFTRSRVGYYSHRHQSLGVDHLQVIVEADIEKFGQRHPRQGSRSKSTWSGRSEDTECYVYRNFAYDKREPDCFLGNNTLASYETTTSTQTDSPDMYEVYEDIPRFCPDWQFTETITAKGGTLKGEHSDVRLEIGARATGKVSIVVKGAVCTDLDVVHKNFQLQEDEFIVTPVVEYQANGGNFRFEKPVRIVLPHFLPPNFAQSKIRAYECCRSATGDWKLNQLQLEDKSNTGSKNGHQQVPGVFYFAEKNEIHVLTDHFSIYFCTDCEEFTPPELFLKVFTKFTDEGSEAQVDVRLDIWDTRLAIQDFSNGVYGHDTVNQRGMVQVDTKILGAVARHLLDIATLEVSLDLTRASERERWMHATRPNGDFFYPPDRKLDLKRLVPCACKTRIPRRVDWQLCSAPNKAPADSCRCVLDAAYVTKDGNDVTTHEKVTIDFKAEKNMVDGLKKLDTPTKGGRPPLTNRIQNNLTPTADPADTQVKQLVELPDSLTLTLENASLGSQSEEQGAVGGSPSSGTSIPSATNVFIGSHVKVYNEGRQRSSTGRRSGSSSDGSRSSPTSPGVPPSGASNEAFEVLTSPPTQVSNADETAGPSYPHG